MPRSSTVAFSIGLASVPVTVTVTLAAGFKWRITGSLALVSRAVTGPAMPLSARATSVYGRPTSAVNANPPSASVVATRGGFEPSTTVAPPTG